MITQLNIDNLLVKLQKQLKGVADLEEKTIQLDQIILQARIKETKLEEKLKQLTLKQRSLESQKIALKKIVDQSKKAGFLELKRSNLAELKKIWQKEDPQLFQSLKDEEEKLAHLTKKFYLAHRERILRTIGMDKSQQYHYQDITIPQNLTWEI